MRVHWIALGAAAVVLAGCSKPQQPPPEYPLLQEPQPAPQVAEPKEQTEVEPAKPTPPPPPPVRVVAGERTPIEGKAPRIRILRPRNGQTIRRGDVKVVVRLRNWDLEPAPGKHIHVIVDNEPYIAVRDVKKPLDLNDLVKKSSNEDLSEGTHLLRVFPSRATHESVKEGAPFAMVVFNYKTKTKDWKFDPKAPLLTYSRPKGCYPEGERILLDFYLTNVDKLSADGFKVHYAVDDVVGDITSWAPHYIENLQPGQHTVHLQLLGADGNAVAGPFNDTTRTIQVGDCEQEKAAAPETGEQEEEPAEGAEGHEAKGHEKAEHEHGHEHGHAEKAEHGHEHGHAEKAEHGHEHGHAEKAEHEHDKKPEAKPQGTSPAGNKNQ